MKKGIKGAFLALIIFVFGSFVLMPVSAPAQEDRIIRVGFPIQKGLTEIDSDGNYKGYSYEYLQAIAQYTGWRYEFVQIPGGLNDSLGEMMDMLAGGELDLLGGLLYSDELAKQYDYSGTSYGTAYSVLYALHDNASINEMKFQSYKNMRVAVLKGAKNRNEKMLNFCSLSGITPQIIECDTPEEQILMLKEDRADTMVDVDLSARSEMRIIARFAPQQYYFATTRGNSDILSALNAAITKIDEVDPYFASSLYEKYFNITQKNYSVSDEEQSYVDQAEPLRVAVYAGKPPIQSVNKKTGELWGISLDVMEEISQKTGLAFEYIPMEAGADSMEVIRSGQYDLLLGSPYDFDVADYYDIVLTQPYVSSQIVLAANKTMGEDDLKGKRAALPMDFANRGEGAENALRYATLEDCLKAVNSGDADYSYGNGYSIQYYINRGGLKNTSIVPQSDRFEEVCIGIVKPADTRLLTILNKAINSIKEEEIQDILYRNTAKLQGKVTLADFIDSNPRVSILLVGAFSLSAIAFVLLITLARIRLGSQAALDNEKFRQLSALSNEYIVEYDYKRDKLMLSEQAAAISSEGGIIAGLMERLGTKEGDERQDAREFLDIIHVKKDHVAEFNHRQADGTRRWVRVTVKVIFDGHGMPVYSISKIKDIHEEKLEKEYLKEQAQKDGLTNIYNALALKRVITDYLNSREEGGALFIIDIDRFKEVNDQFGHYMGDQVLIEMANLLLALFRKDDIVGRLGGDEFIVFVKGIAEKEVLMEKARELCKRAAGIGPDKGIGVLSISVGGALAGGTRDYETLYKEADLALYRIKNNGKNGADIF